MNSELNCSWCVLEEDIAAQATCQAGGEPYKGVVGATGGLVVVVGRRGRLLHVDGGRGLHIATLVVSARRVRLLLRWIRLLGTVRAAARVARRRRRWRLLALGGREERLVAEEI